MKAMIFAAGLGTRLKPITDHMPKALVPVGGKPLLQIQLEKLREAGFTEVVVNVHHFADQIETFLSNFDSGMHVQISDERQKLLDTGGGLKHARRLFNDDDEPILIHNVDILSNANLCALYPYPTDARLLVSERKTQRYLLFDNDMRLIGWTNLATGEVKSPYEDIDPTKYKKYAFAGIHLFSPNLFQLMDSWTDKFSIIDFYLSVCAQVNIQGLLQPDLQLLDVGKQNTLAAADDFVKNMRINS